MKFNFKTLQYQSDAVRSIIEVFSSQNYCEGFKHRHDRGNQRAGFGYIDTVEGVIRTDIDVAYCNNDIEISDHDLLENVRNVQRRQGLPESDKIIDPLGRITLDIEMETGTGKTYVYTKSIFELNKVYGWSKFIIIVPNVAIREGVLKSIQTTEDHFMEMYGKKLRAFVYDSSNLNKIDEFSQNSGINVMIINSQAFAASFREDASNKESRIIYSERDEFASRRPIDVLASNHPILILDEPQKLGKYNSKTQTALRKHFNALFSMNFSATHESHHNQIYSLDALDAYNEKLVKKISVKGIKINHLTGAEGYIYVEGIVIGQSNPKVRIEMYINHLNGIKKETRLLNVRDNLYEESNHIESYKGLFIKDIDGIAKTVSFSDGLILHAGESFGDVTEHDKRRIQIRETILSHLDKENKLFKNGIKVLSLFFIDQVSKYRSYDENGNEEKGEYAKIFEEEFSSIIRERKDFYDPDYVSNLLENDITKIHSGYFSIDKKGHMVDGEIKKGSEESTDVSAYDLILKNKERLLSFEEPVRFIFSHSALSEGWDNPNVFQICALKHTDSTTRRRQEVGRGMRICVNQTGDRQDYDALGPRFHDVNSLTVIADEDYESFIKGLQDETVLDIRHRAVPLTKEYLEGKVIIVEQGEFILDQWDATFLYKYLVVNNYIGKLDDLPTNKLKEALDNGTLEELPKELINKKDGITNFLRRVSSPKTIRDICEDGRKPKIRTNELNSNFGKKEFLDLWNQINHVYHYRVSFDSEELIRHAVANINENLLVTGMSYTITYGQQKSESTYEDAVNHNGFDRAKTSSGIIVATSNDVKYDLIGRIATNTSLTRRTIGKILYRMENRKFDMFKINPEEFIKKVSDSINEEKSSVIVEHIAYNMTDETFDSSIFTMNRPEGDFDKAYKAVKNVQDYIFPDSNIERKFAEDLDGADEVVVYAKLPDGKGGFCIPTPMGDYTPDWAIAFQKESVRHIYFVAETKGSMSSQALSRIEESKITCVKKLFGDMGFKVGFGKVTNYADLLAKVRSE